MGDRVNAILYRLYQALGRRFDRLNMADVRDVRNDWRSRQADWDDYRPPYPTDPREWTL